MTGVQTCALPIWSDSTDYQVNFTFRNAGKLPTAFRQAQLVKIVREDRFSAIIDALPDGEKGYRVIEEQAGGQARGGAFAGAGTRAQQVLTGRRTLGRDVGHTDGGNSNTVTFTIRVYGKTTLKGRASVNTTRAGQLTDQEFMIVLQ